MKVLALALNTFRESARDRLAFLVLLSTLAFVGAGIQLIELSVGNWHKMVTEIGLSAGHLGGLLLILLVGLNVMTREIQRRTALLVFSRPVATWQFIVGKYTGFLLVLIFALALISLLLWTQSLLLAQRLDEAPPPVALALYFMALELAMLSAAAIFASLLVNPASAALSLLVFFALGHTTRYIEEALYAHGGFGRIAAFALAIVPDLERYNLKSVVMTLNETPLGVEAVLRNSLFAAAFIAVMLAASVRIVNRREMN